MTKRRAISHAALAAALALGVAVAHGANAPGALDLPPQGVTPLGSDLINQPPAPPPAARAPERSVNPLWAIPLSTLTATREKPIFLPSRRPPAPAVAGPPPAVAAPPPPPPAEPQRPQLALVGAIVGDAESFAIFLDQSTGAVLRLKTGEGHGGWVLQAVKGREAILQREQETVIFTLPVPGQPAPPPGTQIPGVTPGAPAKEPEL
jgi:general secretion pathway protein N